MAPLHGNEVLRALDKAKTQTYHFKAIIIAGMGFFTDAYDLFVISVLTKLLGRIYYYDASPERAGHAGVLPVNVYCAVLATALCGTLAGQLFFGWAGDRWGRKKVYGITLALMVAASLGQGLSIYNSPTAVITTLCFFRFWLGFGIGGDYPLSATIMSEYSNTKTRGAFVAAVFAMQGIGILAGGAMCIIVSAIFKAAYPRPAFDAPNGLGGMVGPNSTAPQADWVWRLVLMFGAVPAALTFYSRSKMPETARYTALVEKDQKQAALDMGRVLNTEFADEDQHVHHKKRKSTEFGLFSRKFVRRHGMELFGCCVSWFLLDVSFYSQNLFQGVLFTAVGWLPAANEMSALEEVYKTGRAQALIALVSTVPGYWFTVAFIDRVGRKPIQLMGFFMMSVFLYVLAFDFYKLRGVPVGNKFRHGNHLAFIILYSFTFFFSNFGPNATTFIIPSELFPARLRSTCSGIAAAAGKTGAIVGTFGFIYASQDAHEAAVQYGYKKGIGFKYSLLLLAMCATAGFFVTIFCVPETVGRSLEDLSGEDEDNNAIADANDNGGKDNDDKGHV